MNKKLKTFLILSLVLLLFLLPLMSALSQVEALKGGKSGFIILGIFLLFCIIYWIVMLGLIKKGKK